MKKWSFDFWDLIIVAAALLIIFWASLKAAGIIHSPIWVEMIPYFSIGVVLLGGIYKLGKIKQGIENTEMKVNKILSIEERFTRLENEHSLAMQGKIKFKH